MEIERKWLIDSTKIPYDLNIYEHWDIEQAYISFKPTIRIRKIGNIDKYILTIKGSSSDNGLSRDEYEIYISEKEYNDLLNKTEGLILSKTRYRVPVGDLLMEIDFFHRDYEGLSYMEIEFENTEEANKFETPDWVIKELTYDKRFTNAKLAKSLIKAEDFYKD